MNDITSSDNLWTADSAGAVHPGLSLVIEDLDGLGEHTTALFTVCVLATPDTGLLAA
ncbi:hypothetical protein RI138_14975 [Streptomyces sp. C11-1]|uniref:Uncharacterized protein n=1 Tax=Streptomyces durocortorensis TaxID=2811104 RepID=A0ABY9VYJ1_9ACTN|nr:hypothetical protein [Streptomyces durocortorensis]WNF28027.1 hypothetical protein RI138_14975 [Streptomyces durocortorensis]